MLGERDPVRINNDRNGNPRFFIRPHHVGRIDNDSTPLTRSAGLVKHTSKRHGRGYVFQSYNLADSVRFINETLGP